MKRVNLIYGGIQYSVGGREPAELKAAISEALRSEEPFWLPVNQGEGVPRRTDILITRGIDIAIIPVPEPEMSDEEYAARGQNIPPAARG